MKEILSELYNSKDFWEEEYGIKYSGVKPCLSLIEVIYKGIYFIELKNRITLAKDEIITYEKYKKLCLLKKLNLRNKASGNIENIFKDKTPNIEITNKDVLSLDDILIKELRYRLERSNINHSPFNTEIIDLNFMKRLVIKNGTFTDWNFMLIEIVSSLTSGYLRPVLRNEKTIEDTAEEIKEERLKEKELANLIFEGFMKLNSFSKNYGISPKDEKRLISLCENIIDYYCLLITQCYSVNENYLEEELNKINLSLLNSNKVLKLYNLDLIDEIFDCLINYNCYYINSYLNKIGFTNKNLNVIKACHEYLPQYSNIEYTEKNAADLLLYIIENAQEDESRVIYYNFASKKRLKCI